MGGNTVKYAHGEVRDAIRKVLSVSPKPLSVNQIQKRVTQMIGPTPTSSVRSYLRLNTPQSFVRQDRGVYTVRVETTTATSFVDATPRRAELLRLAPVKIGKAELLCDDCFDWLEQQLDNSFHAILTDPPYGLHEYTSEQQTKLRNGKGGVWRI